MNATSTSTTPTPCATHGMIHPPVAHWSCHFDGTNPSDVHPRATATPDQDQKERAQATILLPLTPELVAGFAAVAPHTSADDVSLVLTMVRVDHWTLRATDRYTAAEYRHTTYDESVARHGEAGPADPSAFVLLPREAVAWIAKLKPAKGSGMTLALGATSVEMRYASGGYADSITFDETSLNFPPVERLLREARDELVEVAPFGLTPKSLTKLAKSATAIGRATRRKDEPVRFYMAASGSERRTQPPILATVGGRFRAMVQPVIFTS